MRPAVYCICRWHCKTSINYFIATVIVGAAAATAVRRAFYEFIRACHIRLHTHLYVYIFYICCVCVCVCKQIWGNWQRCQVASVCLAANCKWLYDKHKEIASWLIHMTYMNIYGHTWTHIYIYIYISRYFAICLEIDSLLTLYFPLSPNLKLHNKFVQNA